ncbi:hypothetical protein DH2020_020451 [Rehmannia glutinosa]|uniref:Reverse transcriptase domain-containing protein n=1 Tax=Rehmannia glutinosa TaxID=99300 RepID=A0ABR0WG86_REHGL
MNILSWNCRGLGNPRTIRELRELIRIKSPHLVFLCETKSNHSSIDKLKNSLNLHGISVESNGRSGGLALLWRKNIQVSLRVFSSHFIDVNCTTSNTTVRITGVYGEPNVSRRRNFWNFFKSISSADPSPWVCFGDFNEVLSQSNYLDGLPDDGKLIVSVKLSTTAAFPTWASEARILPGNASRSTLSHNKLASTVVLVMALSTRSSPGTLSTISLLFPPTTKPSLSNSTLPPPHHYRQRRKLPWRFEACWVKSKECEKIIKDSWIANPNSLPNKIKECSENLHNWSRTEVGCLTKRISKVKNHIATLKKKVITEEIKREIHEQSKLYDFLLEQNDIKWKQRAKQHWYKEGDRNTSYFHRFASIRRDINHISYLKDSNGQAHSDDPSIERIIRDYFENIFASSYPSNSDLQPVLKRIRPRVTASMNTQMTQPYSANEVRKALKEMHPFKSPGPDGMSPVFYQKFWHIVGNDVTNTVLNFLNNLDISHISNFTHIVLIPKLKKADILTQFRPISLCNVVYKLASKCIANRIQYFLPDIISESQSAFIPGRLITDNILLAYETHHFMRSKTSSSRGLMSVKLDMSKAFDRVEWPFLLAVLKALGFDDAVIHLIHLCISSTAFSFLLNGKEFGNLTPHRGIRQGDPLSPYLFIFCSEVFSCLLQDLQLSGKIHGVSVCKQAPHISHLFFADDTLLFGHATVDEARHLKYAIRLYEKVSGQQINIVKSGVYFSPNTKPDTINSILQILGMIQVDSHGKYLGLPSVIGKSKRDVFACIKDRVWTRIEGWKEKQLSQAGKEIIIKSVIQSIPTFVMSCFKLPDSLLDDLQKMTAAYWWGSSTDQKKLHWISWDTLSVSKPKGGFGFRNLRAFNMAMLSKQAWRLLTTPFSLLARVFKAKYYPDCDFMHASLGPRPSWSWRSIFEAKPLLRLGARRLIRSGTSTRIWIDPWIPGSSSFYPRTPPNTLHENALVSSLIDEATKNWNVALIKRIFSPDDVKDILSISLPTTSCCDLWSWHLNKNGKHSVRTAYHAWLESDSSPLRSPPGASSSNGPNPLWKRLWKLNIQPKIKNFLWRLQPKAIATSRI